MGNDTTLNSITKTVNISLYEVFEIRSVKSSQSKNILSIFGKNCLVNFYVTLFAKSVSNCSRPNTKLVYIPALDLTYMCGTSRLKYLKFTVTSLKTFFFVFIIIKNKRKVITFLTSSFSAIQHTILFF